MFTKFLLHANLELSAHSSPFGWWNHFENENAGITTETLPHSLPVFAGGPLRSRALPVPLFLTILELTQFCPEQPALSVHTSPYLASPLHLFIYLKRTTLFFFPNSRISEVDKYKSNSSGRSSEGKRNLYFLRYLWHCQKSLSSNRNPLSTKS